MRIAVCDDQKEHQNILEEYINEYMEQGKNMEREKDTYEISKFFSGENLIEAYEKKEVYDILFLDMYMEGISGIEVADRLRKMNKSTILVFVTSDPSHSLAAFRADAMDYIVKPIKKDIFKIVMDKVTQQWKIMQQIKEEKRYIVQYKKKIMEVKYKDILYIDSSNGSITLKTTKGDIIDGKKLKKVENEFIENGFLKISRFQMVNVDAIVGIDDRDLLLNTGKVLIVSRSFKKKVKEEISMRIIRRRRQWKG